MRIPTSEFTNPLAQRGQSISLFIDGRAVTAYKGETIAAVLLAEEQRIFRRTSQRDENRSLFCGIGVCYDCLVTVDGQTNVRACVTTVGEGMRVETRAEVGNQRSERGGRGSASALRSQHPQTYQTRRKETSNNQQSTVNEEQRTDVTVVGAGPAGLEAALVAAETGAQVTLVDSAPRLGGQYFKQAESVLASRFWGDAIPKMHSHQKRLQATKSLQLLTDTQVWGAFPDDDGDWLLTLHGQNAPYRLHTQVLILAPGAYDRPIAFPGWTLPGVVTAGAVQTLLKSQAVLPGRRFVLAGSGPLQLVVAAQLVKAGAEVVAVLEASSISPFLSVRHLPAIYGQWERMQEGWSAWRTLRQAGVPIRFGWAMAKAEGHGQIEAITIAKLDQNWHPLSDTMETIKADTLVLGYGFLPSTQLTRLLGCEHHYSSQQGGWIPLRDERMQTTLPGVYAVGDGAGIGGATLAGLEGQLAGLDAAHCLKRLDNQQFQAELARLQPQVKREHRFAELLGQLFTPRPGLYSMADEDTIICRCEEVTLGEIRRAQAFRCSTLNEIKGLTRAGMGNCQGRICGDLLAHTLFNDDLSNQKKMQEIQNLGCFSVRPPIHPMTVQDLAQSAIYRSEIDIAH